MVATRKSLPNLAFDSRAKHKASIPKELRRLTIDGKATMLGEAPKAEQQKTYRWRGAAYAVTDDTPHEWLGESHKESRKRKSESQAPALVVKKPRLEYRRSLPTKPDESPLRFNLSRSHRVLQHVEAERRTARRKGYTVEMLPTREEREKKAAGYYIAANVKYMASLNTRIAKLQEKYDEAKEALQKIKKRRERDGLANGEERIQRIRRPARERLPARNRGGQLLRWSIKEPLLSNKLGDAERAENAIHKGRLNGESKQARRRRIRREMQTLRGWQEVET